MEREETEEKESVRKTEKERHEMKYEAGDKVKVRSDLKTSVPYGGLCVIDEMLKKKIVTITYVYDGCYKVVEDDYAWTDEMLEGLVEEELTAEEAIKVLADMCTRGCKNCELGKPVKGSRYSSCSAYRREHPDEVIEIIKQYKKDHEKKPIEMESVGIVRVIEDTGFRRKCVYEEELTERENPMDAKERVLKEYCQKHAGKFFTVFESICRVKE